MPSPPSTPSRREDGGEGRLYTFIVTDCLRSLLFALAPAALAAALYLPTLHAGLAWDDPLVLHHARYLPPVDWGAALGEPFVLSPNYYRPLAVFTLAAIGDNPTVQHGLNLVLHAVNTLLVGALAQRLHPTATAFHIAPWLYAAHPVLVEPTAFIAGRFDLMVTAFLLLALWADLALRARVAVHIGAVGACALLAALSKEMAAVLPLVLLAWVWATDPAPRLNRAFLRRATPGLLAAGLGLSAYLLIRFSALGYLYLTDTGRSLDVGTPLQHALLVARSLAEYAVLVVFPFVALSPIHYSPLPLPLDAPTTWLGLALAALVVVGLAIWARRSPQTGALAVGGALALLPVLNLAPLELGGGAFIAERFLTFPLALVTLAVSRVIEPIELPWVRGAAMVWGLAALATVQLTVPHWKNDETLWRWAVTRAPQSPTPFTNLSLVEINRGNPSAGLSLANEALARNPNEANAHSNAALALVRLGRYDEAARALRQAIALRPENALYYSNLAAVLREQGDLQASERLLLDEALPRDPRLWTTHFNLGLLYLRADRPDLAIVALEEALRWAPPNDRGEIQSFLAQTREPTRWLRLVERLLAAGQPESALRAVEQAQALGASETDVAIGRGAALTAIGRLDEAETIARAALTANQNDARLHNLLGQVALARGDKVSAQRWFEQAIALAPDWPLPRQNLERAREGGGR